MVYTTLRKEGAPLIRYRSRDLTRAIPGECPCGSPLPRHDRIVGRSDDMFIVRGVNIYPSHIDEILSREKGIGSEFQIHLDHYEDGKDYLVLKVEREDGGNSGGRRRARREDRARDPQGDARQRQGGDCGLPEPSPDGTQGEARLRQPNIGNGFFRGVH